MKKFRIPALALGAALLLSPAAAMAERHRIFVEPRVEVREHHHHFRPYMRNYYVDPLYPYAPYGPGYYDAWGFWHPYWR